jgi:hypothetical protein
MAREANSSAESVSEQLSAAGEQHTSSEVLQLPPTLSSRMRVSFESRNGTCFFLSASACASQPESRPLNISHPVARGEACTR